MNWIQSFKMAFKSIMSKKGRSVLTMLGIIIGIASVMTIVSVVSGYNKQTMDRINSMGTNRVSVYAYRQDQKDIFPGLYDYCLGMSDIIDGITPSSSIWVQGGVRYGSRSSNNMEYAPQLYLGSDQYSACNNFEFATLLLSTEFWWNRFVGKTITYDNQFVHRNRSGICII